MSQMQTYQIKRQIWLLYFEKWILFKIFVILASAFRVQKKFSPLIGIINQCFLINARLKLAKNQANAKQLPET